MVTPLANATHPAHRTTVPPHATPLRSSAASVSISSDEQLEREVIPGYEDLAAWEMYSATDDEYQRCGISWPTCHHLLRSIRWFGLLDDSGRLLPARDAPEASCKSSIPCHL